MIKTNYAKITGEYPEYLRLQVELQSPLIINGITHPIGGRVSAAPTIEASKAYEFAVFDGILAVQEVAIA